MSVIPDFTSAAFQQADQNKMAVDRQAQANRANQFNGMGSLTWGMDPNGTWTQGVRNNYQGQNDQLGDIASDSFANLGEWGTSDVTRGVSAMPEGGYGAVQSVIDATKGLQAPGLAANENSRRQQLAAMGITLGSDASNDSERNLGNVRSDADLKAILAGTTEYGNVFSRDMARRQQGFNENVTQSNLATALREKKFNQGTNALTAIKGNQPTFASYSAAGLAPGADTYGALADTWRTAQGNQAATQARQANNVAGNMGLLGAGVSALGGLSGIGSLLGSGASAIGNWFSGGSAGGAGGGSELDSFLGGGGWGTGMDFGNQDFGDFL